jgi:hypothetical protein
VRRPLASRLVALSLVGALGVLAVVALARLAAPGQSGGDAIAGASTGASSAPVVSSPPSLDATTAPSLAAPRPTSRPTSKPAAAPTCRTTDQDRYVYHPSRLEVVRACVRVTGTVAAIRTEADGDLHILLRLDAAYRGLLRPANQGEELGDLVVEPVCVGGVTQADAVAICASDPDPLAGPFPSVGQHVSMEGRYVLDLDHSGWAELHPLYRWAPS